MRALAAATDLALPAPPAWLVEECGWLEPPPVDERAYVLRDEAATLLDRLLVRVARGRGAIEVALGEALAALSVGDRALQLGYSSLGDYARERLDVAPRTAQAMVRLARALRERPVLRGAVIAGEVSARKAQAILPLAAGDAEAAWTERARAETVRALEAAAKDAAGDAPEDEERWERIDAILHPEGRAVVDRALALAGDLLGAASPRWQRIEALCDEYLGEHPVEPHPDDERGDLIPRRETAAMQEALEVEFQKWVWLDELHASGPADRGPGGPVAVTVPDSADGRADVRHLDADLRRLAAMRSEWDALLGHLAMLVQACGLWRDMKFASFGHYCSERLAMSGRAVQQRTALERKLYGLPELRAAMKEGRVSYEKARLVASIATEASLQPWIAQAERSPVIALRRLVDAAEDRQMCARREIVLRLPTRVGALVRAAFRVAREVEGRWLTPGECLVRVAEHFIATWEAMKRTTVARKVLARDQGLCQVPGCSRSADDSHHIIRRSAGGGDELWNQAGMCKPHHLHGVHAGYIRVRGRAPDGLTWELGRGFDGGPLEVLAPYSNVTAALNDAPFASFADTAGVRPPTGHGIARSGSSQRMQRSCSGCQ